MNQHFRPYLQRADDAKGVFSDCIEDLKGVKKARDALGLEKSQVFALSNPLNDAEPRYEHIRDLTRAGATAAAEDLARLAGGYFVPCERHGESLQAALSRFSKEAGELTSIYIAAQRDGKTCPAKKEEIRKELREALNAIVRASQAIELVDTPA